MAPLPPKFRPFMSPRKPNMLEAFQASAKAELAKQEEARAAGTAPLSSKAPGKTPEPSAPMGVGGPFAVGESEARPHASVGNEILGTAPRRAPRPTNRTPWVIGLVVVSMVGMFYLGRDFRKGTVFGQGDGSESSQQGEGDLATELPAHLERTPTDQLPVVKTDPPAVAKPSGMTEADRAFLDLNNRISVRAIQFDNDKRGTQRAREIYRYLREQGLPAVAPIAQGEVWVICVGAEPALNPSIERVRAQLQQLPGPPPQSQAGAFNSAYFVNIEDQIDESLRH
ncbi:MAG: hypothetical protein ACI9F9_000175 [Candidatus Paceibacteria bacterium]|jgi:hypothetical protein